MTFLGVTLWGFRRLLAEFICQVDCGKNEMMRNNKMPSAVTIVVWIICITKMHLIEYFWKKKRLFRAVNYIRLLFCFYFLFSFLSFPGFAVATSAHKRLNLEQIY